MAPTLYHFSPAENRASILRYGLDAGRDKTAGGDGVGVVYLIDRLGDPNGADGDRELWRQPRPQGKIPEGVSDDELLAYFDGQRAKEQAWKRSLERALARGELTPEEAQAKGWYGLAGERWGELPGVSYHVTTHTAGVAQSGLKTRAELGQGMGAGLGGGDSDTISLTEDLATAQGIASALREMHDVARGKLGVAELLEQARAGTGAQRPFLAEVVHYWSKTWKPGDPWPNSVKALLAGMKVARGSLGGPPDAEHEWVIPPDADLEATWRAADGRVLSNYWWRKATPEEAREDAVDVFKTFAAFRQWAGGPLDPLFFLSDPSRLAALDKDEIQILQVRGVPGARGWTMNSLGEWRTASGEVLVVQGVVKEGKVEALSGIDVWAVDAEGLTLEADSMWSGEGKSWMVEGNIPPGRLRLLSAERDIPMGKTCPGHSHEEIAELVRGVGGRWEEAFRLWREMEPSCDVPRCRTLLGMGDTGDGWPPREVRELVGLDDNCVPTGDKPWVQAPYEMLGAGEDRFGVALCAEHVLKVDPYWWSATDHEIEVWGKADARLRHYLAPVQASGAEGDWKWLVMPRCQPLAQVGARERKRIEEVAGLGDIHDYNLGQLDGRVVIMDYGTSDESGPVRLARELQAEEELVSS